MEIQTLIQAIERSRMSLKKIDFHTRELHKNEFETHPIQSAL